MKRMRLDEMQQNVKSERPSHDRLIAQIDNFLVWNLNNSYPSEKHEKEIELKMYMRIDKLSSRNLNKSNTKKSILEKFLPIAFINFFSREKSELIEINGYNLGFLEARLNSVFENRSYIVPFSHKNKEGNPILGVDLDLKAFIKKIKSGEIKITWYIYDDLESSCNIIRIAYTLKDRIKVEHLPIILKVVRFEEELVKDNNYVQHVLTRTNYRTYNPLELTMDKEHKVKEWTNTIKLFTEKEIKVYVRPPKASTHIRLKNL